ncbi:MAG: NAD/FAD-utilizing enzyme [Gammaproteobacteria bacterium]|jgi:hypothetical protein
MKRHFYVTDDLDDLDRIEEELESRGVHRPQIHVFSRDDAAVETRDHLHNIESVFKQDLVHGTLVGIGIGVLLAGLVLVAAAFSDLPGVYTWTPFVMLAIVLLGFCAWSGGLYGIQVPNRDFRRFEAQLRAGKHVFIVDVDPEQEAALARVVNRHPHLQLAGTGKATPRWIVMGKHNIIKFTTETFP